LESNYKCPDWLTHTDSSDQDQLEENNLQQVQYAPRAHPGSYGLFFSINFSSLDLNPSLFLRKCGNRVAAKFKMQRLIYAKAYASKFKSNNQKS